MFKNCIFFIRLFKKILKLLKKIKHRIFKNCILNYLHVKNYLTHAFNKLEIRRKL